MMAGDRILASSLRFSRDGKGVVDDYGVFAAAVVAALQTLPGADEAGDKVLILGSEPTVDGVAPVLYWQVISDVDAEIVPVDDEAAGVTGSPVPETPEPTGDDSADADAQPTPEPVPEPAEPAAKKKTTK